MPLITLKCTEDWYPLLDDSFSNRIGRRLPELFASHQREMCLDPDTTPEAVQVEYERFSIWDINVPDINFKVTFTEDPGKFSRKQRIQISQSVRDLIRSLPELRDSWRQAKPEWMRPKITIDVFWGPGHGCMLDAEGEVTLEW